MRPIHPSELSPDHIRHEISSILAAGVLRLRKQRRLIGEVPSPEESAKTVADRLEVLEETVLSGDRVNGSESLKQRRT